MSWHPKLEENWEKLSNHKLWTAMVASSRTFNFSKQLGKVSSWDSQVIVNIFYMFSLKPETHFRLIADLWLLWKQMFFCRLLTQLAFDHDIDTTSWSNASCVKRLQKVINSTKFWKQLRSCFQWDPALHRYETTSSCKRLVLWTMSPWLSFNWYSITIVLIVVTRAPQYRTNVSDRCF